MLNIVIPMAGSGSRFASAGYVDPKPLIRLYGVPMIQWVIGNLTPAQEHRFIFICQRAHLQDYHLLCKFESWAPGSALVTVDRLTEGAACTVLRAKSFIDNDDGLMIANSDQYVDVDIDKYIAEMHVRGLDGQIMTMKASDPKWSFIGISDIGHVNAVVEKCVISDEATTGIYNFKRGHDFVTAAESMIRQDLRVDGEFYVAPTYNQLIRDGANIGYFNIGSEGDGMYGLGTPDDLNKFLSMDISKRVFKNLKCRGVSM